jgi:beta-glucanase (GH16 family)
MKHKAAISVTAVAALALTASVSYQAWGDAAEAPGSQWPTVFADDFDTDAIDKSKWTIYSDAESDQCLGNDGNQQLEWHTWDALSVADGQLTITARRDNPQPGYEWSSGLITTGQSCGNGPGNEFSVQPGDYLETRLKLPEDKGLWPSTWTWNGDGSNEQDSYEYYSDNPRRLYLTNHHSGTGCEYDAPADLTGEWHTIGEQLGPDETVWYLDGEEICRGGTFAGDGAVVVDMFVYSQIPPTVDEASMAIDYVRVHRR